MPISMHMIALFRVMNPHQSCLKPKVKKWNGQKQVQPKKVDPSRSLELKEIRTSDTRFSIIFNQTYTYISLKSALILRQLSRD